MAKLFWGPLFKILGVALIVFIIIGSVSYIWNYLFPNNSFSGVIDPIEGERINTLVLATDKGGLLTDTVILASVNTKSKKINLLSIPRDTLVPYRGRTVMMNSVYGRGKENERHNASIEVVRDITGLPINYYVVVKPDGFKNVVDALGGVYIDVPQDMEYHDPTPGQELHVSLKKGYQKLNGDKTEQFTRFRGYPNADLGRIEAQQTFLRELFKQKVNAGLIIKAPALYKAITKNIETNFSASSVPSMVKIITSFDKDSVNTYTLPGRTQNNRIVYDKEKTKKLIEEVFLKTEEENED